MQISKAIQENNSESRKEWMLNIFGYTGSQNKNNKEFQFWRQFAAANHPIELNTSEKFKERLDYLHNNPVEVGIVWVRRGEWHYKYSSAIDYHTQEKGLLRIEI